MNANTRQSGDEIQKEPAVVGADERHQRLAQPAGEHRAAECAERGDQQALREHLAHEPLPRRPDREAYGDLAFARGGPRQHQVREVRARDEQHQAGRAEQDPELGLVRRAEPRDPRAGRLGGERERQVVPGRLGVVSLRQRGLEERRRYRCSCASACRIVTPGASRPMMSRNQVSRRPRADCSPRKIGSAQSGRATSNVRPTSTPKKLAGVTPTISNGRLSSVIVWPTAAGLPPYRDCQKPYASTAPGAPQPARSSAAVSTRPMCAFTPSVLKKLPLT
jgi:hypothetical protein